MPTQEDEDDKAWREDMAAGRRVELDFDDFKVTLQYFPEFNNVSFSFYTKNMPGFTFGMPTEVWPRVQAMVAAFNWRGRKQ